MMTPNENDAISMTLEAIRSRIAENIRTKQRLDGKGVIYASGKTIASMEMQMRQDGGALLGRENFRELETGVPPRPQAGNFRDIIREWAEQKAILIDAEPFYMLPAEMQDHWASGIAWKIEHKGSVLYRDYGGRQDIFTDVIEDEVEKLHKTLSDIVTETISEVIWQIKK